MRRANSIVLILVILSSPLLASSENDYYVQKGDTLSILLTRLNLIPVYGRKGSLTQIIKQNLWLQKSSGNLIRPGEKIRIIFSENSSQINRQISEEKNMKVLFVPKKDKSIREDIASHSIFAITMVKKNVGIQGKSDDGTSGKLNSSSSQGIIVDWQPKTKHHFWPSIGGQWQKTTFNGSTNKAVSGKTLTTEGLYLALNAQSTSKLLSSIRVGQQEQIFYRATASEEIKIEKLPVTYAQLLLRYDFFRDSTVLYGIKADTTIHFPFSNDYYKSQLAVGHKVGVIAEQDLKNFILIGEANYAYDRFPVRGITYKRQDFGIMLGLKWNWGQEQ